MAVRVADSATTRSSWDWAASLALFAIVFVVYLPTLRAGFTNWDDDRFIVSNPLFRGPLSDYVFAALTRIQFEAFQPLHLLSYLPDRIWWPHHPAGFHALNLALYGLALTFELRLLRRHVALVPALAAVLLVGLTPLAVEPVAWVVGRKDVLALLLLLAVLLVEDRTERSRGAMLASCVLAASAGLVKSSTVVLPIVVFAWLRYVRELPLREALRRCAPLVPIAVALALAVPFIWHEHRMISPERPLPVVLDVFGTIGIYLSRILVPIHLAPVYPALMNGQAVAGYLAGLALALLALLWKRLPREAKFAAVGVVGSLLPVANIIPLQFRFADRYLLFAVALLGWPVARLLSYSRIRTIALVLASLVLAAETWLTLGLVPAWRDSLSLWLHATRAQPQAVFAYLKLGETYRSEKRFKDAAAAYVRVGEMEPHGLKGPAGLMRAVGERAEAQGRIPAGSCAAWEAALSQPNLDAERVRLVIEQVDRSGCRSCASAVLWLALRMFPQPDTSLVSAAARELERGRADTALVYAGEVRDLGTPGLAPVLAHLRDLQSRTSLDAKAAGERLLP